MAAHIFHGAPGSFKSASAVWFRLLDELRAGRVVVTNIEGILEKEKIEIELGEVFPDTADIWRLSSQKDKGLFLWRRWFWWMPVKAFIILDEVQDVFPSDTTVFKPKEFDIPVGQSGIELLKEQLPTKFYDHYKKEIADFSPDEDEAEDMKDDTGEVILDDNGHIIYPKTMREANMRHRKYNWDIVYCTPEIKEIHTLLRSVCEFAYYHKYNELLEFIPYYYRRTRIHEHNPKSSGYPKKKDDPTKWRKIPVQVHKLYRSTSTGKVSSAGGGVNALKDPSLIVAISILLICISYAIWWGFFKESSNAFDTNSNNVNQENSQISGEATTKNSGFPNSFNNIQGNNESGVPLTLPYQAQQIYMTGYQTVMLNKDRKYNEYMFKLSMENQEISLNSNDLYYFGITVEFINDCTVKLVDGDLSRIVHCAPKIIERPSNNNSNIVDTDETSA